MTGRGWRRVAWAAAAASLQKLANGVVMIANGLVLAAVKLTEWAAFCHLRVTG